MSKHSHISAIFDNAFQSRAGSPDVYMSMVRHLGTPNSSFLLASLDATVCVIQYYSDQWVAHTGSPRNQAGLLQYDTARTNKVRLYERWIAPCFSQLS